MAQQKKHVELRPSGARLVADRLREHILSVPEGAHLGSEEDLAKLFSIGRHTLRQSARLLEQQRLLRVKRGVGGGYYGMRPDIDAVADASATYLRTRKTTVDDIMQGARGLNSELARLAALSQDDETRGQLAAIEQRLASNALTDARSVEELDFDLRDCMFMLVANPFIELMLRVNVRFAFQEQGLSLVHRADRVADYRDNRLALVRAILARDPEMAMLLAERFNQMVRRWVSEERPGA